jgi:hypothetical protein
MRCIDEIGYTGDTYGCNEQNDSYFHNIQDDELLIQFTS